MKARHQCTLLWVALSLGCGPGVSEVRTSSHPSRGDDCELEFMELDMHDVSSAEGTWQVIGQVVLQEDGVQDPYAEKYRSIVRPRACRMGGEAVAIMTSATSENLVHAATTTSYAVLRRRADSKAEPQKF